MAIRGKPKEMPSKCGILRFIPKLTPDVMIIILFGPDVIDADNANNQIANKTPLLDIPLVAQRNITSLL